jgi:hypothetical protein
MTQDVASATYREGCFTTRLRADPRGHPVWRHLWTYFERWICAYDDVLELGAGWCGFSMLVIVRRAQELARLSAEG